MDWKGSGSRKGLGSLKGVIGMSCEVYIKPICSCLNNLIQKYRWLLTKRTCSKGNRIGKSFQFNASCHFQLFAKKSPKFVILTKLTRRISRQVGIHCEFIVSAGRMAMLYLSTNLPLLVTHT